MFAEFAFITIKRKFVVRSNLKNIISESNVTIKQSTDTSTVIGRFRLSANWPIIGRYRLSVHPYRKPPVIRKDLGDISYIGRVIADFAPNFVAMATGGHSGVDLNDAIK